MAVFSWPETVGIPQCSRQISMSHPLPAVLRFKDEPAASLLGRLFGDGVANRSTSTHTANEYPLMPFAQAYDGPIYFENAHGLAVDDN